MEIQQVLSRLRRVRRSGRGWVACCPAHEDHEPSLSIAVNGDRLLLKCFAGCSFRDIVSALNLPHEAVSQQSATPQYQSDPHPVMPFLDDLAQHFRIQLQRSPKAERYLSSRGIDLDLALSKGVGYATGMEWAALAALRFDTDRIVFPHTRPDGVVVNLYGRAIEPAKRSLRHRHLPGNKGFFCASAFRRREARTPLVIVEGPFDALAAYQMGAERAVAIFGTAGWRESWCRGMDRILIATDADESGRQAARRLLKRCGLAAGHVEILPASEYDGAKDLNELWSSTRQTRFLSVSSGATARSTIAVAI